MATTSGDLGEKANKKFGAKVQFTYEILEQLLYLPEGAKLVSVQEDAQRDIVSFKYHTEEHINGVSYQIGEGMEYPNISVSREKWALAQLKEAYEIHRKAQEGGRKNQWAVDALEMFEEEQK